MWEEREFEQIMHNALINQLGQSTGENIYSQYITARAYLVKNVYPFIVGKERSLTDHSATHVADVIDNARALLGNDITQLNAIELYVLGMAILFHDVGNIKGRVDHFKLTRIAEIYNKIRHNDPKFNQERQVISLIAQAHSGLSLDGSKDTLKDLTDLPIAVEGKRVISRPLAAILRFADELAEGPQRTSYFMQQVKGYSAKSLKFHEYANNTTVTIDRGNNRIALTYVIELPVTVKKLDQAKIDLLSNKLNFIYSRIEKLDQERKYASHYSTLLASFRRTSFCVNIWTKNDIILRLDECDLTDLTIPGESSKKIADIHKNYDINKIITQVNSKLK